MGWDAPDPYYQPEAFGLEHFGSTDRDEEYSFDIFAVWRSKDNPALFYWASDSGCSCPVPFENMNSLTDMDGNGTALDAAEAFKVWKGNVTSADDAALLEKLYAV